MRIGIDARFFGTLGKGLGRYTQQLIEHLEEADTENEYVIFLRQENFDAYVPKNSNFTKALADIPWYSWREQIIFPKILARHHLDLMHFTHFNVPLLYRRPFVLTVHDLILFHFPTFRATTRSLFVYGVKYLAYRLILRSALRRSLRVLAVSRFTKRDIEEHFPFSKGKIVVTYQAATVLGKVSEALALPENFFEKCGILKPYFLYVGNAYPHKNLERLLLAFSALRKNEAVLVLVGKEDYFYRRLRRFAEKKKVLQVVFTGEVTDEELALLYQSAAAYVFPSLYEGFGLPPLEAMAQGTPVLSSSRTAMPEILGSAARYFDPENVESIAASLRYALRRPSFRKRFSQEGLKRVQKFSWTGLARQTKEIYKEVFTTQNTKNEFQTRFPKKNIRKLL